MKMWYNFLSKSKGENTVNQDTVTISKAEYEELMKANEELRQANEDLSKRVSFLMQQIALARQQRFGSSSEKSKYDDGSEQLSFLFNEIEVYADSSSVLKEPDLTTVKEHKRNRKHLTRETDLPEDIETEVVIRDAHATALAHQVIIGIDGTATDGRQVFAHLHLVLQAVGLHVLFQEAVLCGSGQGGCVVLVLGQRQCRCIRDRLGDVNRFVILADILP